MTERNEKRILRISFLSGLAFAIAEFIFSIYSRSHSSLTDAVYDMSELVFIALLLFLTPLFHKPMSEKHPYGYFQVESIFVIIKGVMMLSVTFGISADVIGSALTGGNPVNNIQVALFQLSGIGKHCDFLHNETIQQKYIVPYHYHRAFGVEAGHYLQSGNGPRLSPLPYSGAHPAGLSLPLLRSCCRRTGHGLYAPREHQGPLERHPGHLSVLS